MSTVTSILSDCKFYCFHGDRGGGGVEMVIFPVTSFLKGPGLCWACRIYLKQWRLKKSFIIQYRFILGGTFPTSKCGGIEMCLFYPIL